MNPDIEEEIQESRYLITEEIEDAAIKALHRAGSSQHRKSSTIFKYYGADGHNVSSSHIHADSTLSALASGPASASQSQSASAQQQQRDQQQVTMMVDEIRADVEEAARNAVQRHFGPLAGKSALAIADGGQTGKRGKETSDELNKALEEIEELTTKIMDLIESKLRQAMKEHPDMTASRMVHLIEDALEKDLQPLREQIMQMSINNEKLTPTASLVVQPPTNRQSIQQTRTGAKNRTYVDQFENRIVSESDSKRGHIHHSDQLFDGFTEEQIRNRREVMFDGPTDEQILRAHLNHSSSLVDPNEGVMKQIAQEFAAKHGTVFYNPLDDADDEFDDNEEFEDDDDEDSQQRWRRTSSNRAVDDVVSVHLKSYFVDLHKRFAEIITQKGNKMDRASSKRRVEKESAHELLKAMDQTHSTLVDSQPSRDSLQMDTGS